MEFNKPVTNPMLVGAIEVMKAEPTPEHRNMFINEMLKAEFLAPAIITPDPEPDAEGNLKLLPDNKIQFPMLTTPDGRNFFMAFTDKYELKLWKDEENTRTFAMSFEDYMGMVLRQNSPASGFVLNPYSANIVVPREMLASMMAAKMAQQKGAGVRPGQQGAVPPAASAATQSAAEAGSVGAPEAKEEQPGQKEKK